MTWYNSAFDQFSQLAGVRNLHAWIYGGSLLGSAEYEYGSFRWRTMLPQNGSCLSVQETALAAHGLLRSNEVSDLDVLSRHMDELSLGPVGTRLLDAARSGILLIPVQNRER